MTDGFPTGICSSRWWNASKSSSPGSAALTDIGGFGWSPAARSCELSASINSFSYPENQKAPASGSSAPSTETTDTPSYIAGFGLSPPSVDWNPALLRSSGRAESNFQAMLRESNYRQESPMESFKPLNEGFAFAQQRSNSSSGDSTVTSTDFSMASVSYGFPSTLLQGFFDTDPQSQQFCYENRGMSFSSPMNEGRNGNEVSTGNWSKYPDFLKISPPEEQPRSQLHFSNSTPFWNADAGPGFCPSSTPFLGQNMEERPSSSKLTLKTRAEDVRDSCSVTTKKCGSQPAFKKPRIETPSPLPTFKVRKEKLGDRITALQQLVSPFGKTDTASVLYEAIEYIKFLHEQVTVLSTPYMKNGGSTQHLQNFDKSKEGETQKRDLRSRGLCVVPVSITFPVTHETIADFWTPTFGGTCR